MRRGRPHPTVGETKLDEPTERPAKIQRIATEPGCRFSRGHPKCNEQPAEDTGAGGTPRQQRQHLQDPLIIKYQQDEPPRRNRSATLSSRMETLSPSTDTSSSGTLSPSTKASSISPATDNADDSIKPTFSRQSSSTDCSDCAGLAMQTLQSLTSASTPQPDVEFGPALDSHLYTTSTAIKRLSAILICPCSANSDVGLLNAALCAAILDTYWSILQSPVDYSSLPPPNNPVHGSGNSFNPSSDTISMIDAEFTPSLNMHKRTQQLIVRRVLDELPKAANMVMQFTRRYSVANEDAFPKEAGNRGLPTLLSALVMEQRARLKDMIDKATNLMASVD
ncbi:MAG: hypothetical protein L6R39_000857 [Caloplaca ligustica]|nr:MAG: hypothetical protein L6R39_000857 [Caloplaca ligustica]